MRVNPWAGVTTALLAAALSHAGAAALPDDEKAVVHVLNRVAFGAKPADIERVRTLGIGRYIDEQLHPERIADSSMSARLAHLATIDLSTNEISARYELPLMAARRDRKERAATGSDSTVPREPTDAQRQASAVLIELGEQKVLRAIYSERQLQEVLTDFWFNHFNVDARKGRDRFLLTEYEREAIRPHVLGKFRDLLGATAQSPAMLFYLDNWLSADPNGPHPAGGRRPSSAVMPRGRTRAPMPLPPVNGTSPAATANRRKGLNENYARELMELHTLGVDGGYTQKDVAEVARAFTGWTIDNPREGGKFRFEPRIHDDGEKNVLGHRLKAGGGKSDGERVLDILASHPSTARFISTKLARRFVSDTPPAALVDRLSARFTASRGDLRVVMTELLSSPEFTAPDAYRAKVKSPFEFVVSAMRAVDADVQDARPLVKAVQDLGQPLYQCQPPTGYKDTADAWTNTGALVNRMNFALSFASGWPPRVMDAGDRTPRNPGLQRSGNREPSSIAAWADTIDLVLGHDLSETTRATMAKASAPRERAALALGSPEFQRR